MTTVSEIPVYGLLVVTVPFFWVPISYDFKLDLLHETVCYRFQNFILDNKQVILLTVATMIMEFFFFYTNDLILVELFCKNLEFKQACISS